MAAWRSSETCLHRHINGDIIETPTLRDHERFMIKKFDMLPSAL